MSQITSLVTGAAGFLGSHTVEALLARGHKVIALDLPGTAFATNLSAVLGSPALTTLTRDLMEIPADDSLFAGLDFIFHCAGIPDHIASMKTPEPYIQANVAAVVRVLEAARAHGVKKVVYPSSAAVYGTATPPTREDHPINPDNPYALTKWMGEEVCHHWSKVFGVGTVSFRIFNGYGPRSAVSGPVGFFLKRKKEGLPLTVTGDGTQTRDFIHVDDIVDALIAGALSDRSGEVYNLATGKPQSVLELARAVGGEISFIPPRNEPPVILADVSKLKSELGWEPKVSLAEGIARMVAIGG